MKESRKFNKGITYAAVWLAGTCAPSPVNAQQGYDIVGDQVVVEGEQHWVNWKRPGHLTAIDASGAVRPRELRQAYNLLDDRNFERPVEIDKKAPRIATVDSTLRLDVLGNPLQDVSKNFIYDYIVRPGVSRVGSNPHLAPNILDGDPTTFWEPNPDDPIGDWWIEVHLGRVVPLERLRLQFVDEQLGDPFLKFLLFFEKKQLPLVRDDSKLRFSIFVPFEGVNKDQRIFAFDSERTSGLLPADVSGLMAKRLSMGNADPNWTGRLVEVIRITITDTRGARSEQITQEKWEALPEGERGDVVYFVRDVAGREEPVDEATYEILGPDRQGRRVYYRRELPRLAEVDAWGWGDNIALGMLETGGGVEHTIAASGGTGKAFDGQVASFYRHTYFLEEVPDDNILIADVGGTVWMDQMRILSEGYVHAPTVRGYTMRGSSGVRDAQGRLKWQLISPKQRDKNVDEGYYALLNDVQSPPIKLRFFEFITLKNQPPGNTGTQGFYNPGIGEFMIFSKGSPAEVVLESDAIELPGLVVLGSVRWEAELPPGTDVEIRTRAGDQLLQHIRYFDSGGGEVTADKHKKLPGFRKGPVDTSFVIGPDWTPWSQRYLHSGARVTSPSLRKFMQLQAKLVSSDRNVAPLLRRIEVDMHRPVLQNLLAEVWPEETSVGQVDTFEVYLQPTLLEEPRSERSPGYDEVLLSSEPNLDMRLLDVALGTEEEFARGQPLQLFAVERAEDAASADDAVLQTLRSQGDSLQVRFPQVKRGESADVLPHRYYRLLVEGDEVPTRSDGRLLDLLSYERLDEELQGAIRYFRKTQDRDSAQLEEVDAATFEALEEDERGPVRYFRKVTGVGNQSLFDSLGDTLSAAQYNRLGRAKGWVLGHGRLVRLRFAAAVFLHGTKLKTAMRNSAIEGPWQESDPGDVTQIRPGQGLVIGALGAGDVVEDLQISPNPFTPNGDGINDVAEVGFSLFKVYEARSLKLRIFRLDGTRMRTVAMRALGGRQNFAWDGRDDNGALVPPGLYLAQIEVDADQAGAAGQKQSRLIAVVY